MSPTPRRKFKPTIPTHVPREALAELFGITPTTVSRLTTAGVLQKDEAGFPTAANMHAYLGYVVAVEQRRRRGSDAGQALAERKAELIQRRLDAEDKTIVDIREAVEVMEAITEDFVASFGNVGRHPDMPPKAPSILEEEAQRLRRESARLIAQLVSGKAENFDDPD